MSLGSRNEGLGVGSNVDRPVRAKANNASSKLGSGGRACRRLEHAPELDATSIVLPVRHLLFGLVDRMELGASAWPPYAKGANGSRGSARVSKPSIRENIDAGWRAARTRTDAEGILIDGLRMGAAFLLELLMLGPGQHYVDAATARGARASCRLGRPVRVVAPVAFCYNCRS